MTKNLSKVDNSNTLFINHSIALSQEKLELLHNNGTRVDTVGISIPVWQSKCDEPAKEVFCEYIILSESDQKEPNIQPTATGYLMTLNHRSLKRGLENINEFSFNAKSKIIKDKTMYRVIHQVAIISEEKLEKSMYCLHVNHFISN